MVVSPHSLLDSEGRLRLHGTYYITKQVRRLPHPRAVPSWMCGTSQGDLWLALACTPGNSEQ